MRKNNKGFTLVEIIAAIVILGLLVAIAIPSISGQIIESRKKSTILTINSYMSVLDNDITSSRYKLKGENTIYAVPIECIDLEKGKKSAFGQWMPANDIYWAYVLVQYDKANVSYTYGFTFKDSSGYGMYPTTEAKMSKKGTGVDFGFEINRPTTGTVSDFVEVDKWDGFAVDSDTQLVVLEVESSGELGNGFSTCTLKQPVTVNPSEDPTTEEPTPEDPPSEDPPSEDPGGDDGDSDGYKLLKELIMAHNPTVTDNSNPTLTKTSKSAKENGLYISNATNDGTPTYYFRGAVKNNNVTFAGLTWQIVRINEDGTIRLILKDPILEYPTVEGMSLTKNQKITFNTSDDISNFMYYSKNNIADESVEDSTAKKIVDAWYNKIIEPEYDSYVATGTFCEQAKVRGLATWSHAHYRNSLGWPVSASGTDMTKYSQYTPTFKCKTDLNSKGVINSKAGMITYDEVVHAGGFKGQSNTTYYLYSKNKNILTMTPAGYYGGPVGLGWSAEAYIWRIDGYGKIEYGSTTPDTAKDYIKPVINLNASVCAKSNNDGTASNPYVVDKNDCKHV